MPASATARPLITSSTRAESVHAAQRDYDQAIGAARRAEDALREARREFLVLLVPVHAEGIPGLREAYVSHQADEVIFVGDDWSSLSDRVSDLLDAIGADLDPSGERFIRGGLHLGSEGLEDYTRVPLG